MKKPKGKVVLNLKLEPALKTALAKLAARDEQSSSSIVRKLIADHLRSEGFLK